MKTIKNFSWVSFAFLTLLFTACSSDDNGGSTSSSLDTYITAKVDGVAFKNTISGVAMKNGTGEMSLITIQCANASSLADQQFESIHVILVGISATGTYPVNSGTNNTLAYIENHTTNNSWDTGDCEGVSGTITVTKLTATVVEGTFSFTGANDENCSDTKVITEGKFKGTF